MTTDWPDLLDLLTAVATNPHPLATPERERIIAAMEVVAGDNDGVIDPNVVRRALTNPTTGALDVNPRVLSASYAALAARGFLTRAGWVESDDARGHNGGKRISLWRWTVVA